MGPLTGFKVIEMAGLGPAPFCGMMLSDMGAEVVRIGRRDGRFHRDPLKEVMNRGRRFIALDLKNPDGVAAALRLIEGADCLIEGFRPGVMERLGLGPEICLARNPRLVYGRMTGWGQDGPLAAAAGHDINYIALSGALHCIGESGGGPVPPLNLVGDFGGGGMLLAVGVLAALLETSRSGQGQVIDAAMVDGASALMAIIYGLKAMGMWDGPRGHNPIDGGAPYYGTYRCADGEWICLGAIEPQFYRLMREKTGLLDDASFDDQLDRTDWPRRKQRIAEIVSRRTRAEWCELMEGSDVCFAPVLSLEEAPEHPHNRARGTFIDIAGVTQPAPAPRFSRTPNGTPAPPALADAHNEAVLRDWGFSGEEIAALNRAGAL